MKKNLIKSTCPQKFANKKQKKVEMFGNLLLIMGFIGHEKGRTKKAMRIEKEIQRNEKKS